MENERLCPYRKRRNAYAEGDGGGDYAIEWTVYEYFETCIGKECMAYWEDTDGLPHCSH